MTNYQIVFEEIHGIEKDTFKVNKEIYDTLKRLVNVLLKQDRVMEALGIE